jgi:DNA-directed RNA polymerase II subunit RPB7
LSHKIKSFVFYKYAQKMVFFRKHMTRVINVHPQFLGPKLKQHIKEQCRLQVQGERSVSGLGFVILVLSIEDAAIGKGVIDHLTGTTRYEVGYDAIIFRPFKNEVMDTTVVVCSSTGIFVSAGPLNLFVPKLHVPTDYEFRPEDASWVHPETGATIKAGSDVRVKILGASSQGQVSAVGTINEPYLGLI